MKLKKEDEFLRTATQARTCANRCRKGEGNTAKKKRKKVGRRLEYSTPNQLSRAVAEYFDSISYELPYTNDKGEPICNLAGEEIVLIKYIVPPSIQELCLYLCISMRTFENYSHRPEFSEICTEAKLRIEAYLTEQVNVRDRPQGIIFNLENNFGWKNKKEVELGDGTREAMRLTTMTIEEKQKLLAETVTELTAYVASGDPGNDDDEDE